MPQSLSMNIVHLIYSTKERVPVLSDCNQSELYAYQAGVFRRCECAPITIGGYDDHVHALFVLSKNMRLCDVVQRVKRASSNWLRGQTGDFHGFRWQNGYGAFSVSQSHVPRVRKYIEEQDEHHKTLTFQEEFRRFLKRYNVDYDERYVWD